MRHKMLVFFQRRLNVNTKLHWMLRLAHVNSKSIKVLKVFLNQIDASKSTELIINLDESRRIWLKRAFHQESPIMAGESRLGQAAIDRRIRVFINQKMVLLP